MNEVQQLAMQFLSETTEGHKVLRSLLADAANATGPEKLSQAMNALGRFSVDELAADDPNSKRIEVLLGKWQAAIRRERKG